MWWITGSLLALILLGNLVFATKSLVIHGTLDDGDLRDMLHMTTVLGGSVLLAHVLILAFERRFTAALRKDLAGGHKLRLQCVVLEFDGGDGDNPTLLRVRHLGSDVEETFRAHTMAEHERIAPACTPGATIALEYVPHSRSLLSATPQSEH